MIFGDASNQLN